MGIQQFLDNKIVLAVISLATGTGLTILVQYLLNRRSLFVYHVVHTRIGLTTADTVYGDIRVTWNSNPMSHLYLSSVTITNQSSRDHDSIIVRAYTAQNCHLLTERTSVVDTTRTLEYATQYSDRLRVPEGQQPTQTQIDLYSQRREYLAPTMNRGQSLRLEYLVTVTNEDPPAVWIDILHKGVRCEFRVPAADLLGVPRTHALVMGTMISISVVILIGSLITNVLIASFIAFLLGWLVLLPGAFAMRLIRRFRTLLTG